MINRRDVLALLGGAAAAWPVGALGQQGERVRRVGVLTGGIDDATERARVDAFIDAMRNLGWFEAKNLQLDIRWGVGNVATIRKNATELSASAPDVIFVSGTSAIPWLLQATKTTPIVFANVADPVGAGYVRSLSRPGGNATGFLQFEYSLSAKWVELLKEIAPSVKRVAVLRDTDTPTGIGQFAVIQGVAPALGLEVSPISVAADAGQMAREIAEFASTPDGGLIQTPSGLGSVYRALFIRLAAQHRLPAVYPFRFIAADGGLIAYGPDLADQYRRAATYVDRILKGEKPADLPVQAPTKYELVINLKTARALGLTVPSTLLARADEVIE
jgi:putative tryptophan/tyrosine transport system substrate-binding protein